MGSAERSVSCRFCGEPFLTRAKPGNPTNCRWCGRQQRTPHDASNPGQAGQRHPAAAAAWPAVWRPDTPAATPLRPVADAAGNVDTDDCGGPLFWEPSGTLQLCLHPECPDRGKPAFPLSLISHGRPADDLRREATRDELLDREITLAGRRRKLLALIGQRLEREQLHPETQGALEEVFIPKIRQAQTPKQLDWLTERLFALPVRELAAPQVIQAEVIKANGAANGQHPAAAAGASELGELGHQALASLTSGTGAGLATVPRLALPPGQQALAGAGQYTTLGWCDRCPELRQRGLLSGRFGVAVVRVEFTGQAELLFIDHKPQPALCQDCWQWLQATQPAGSYMVTDQATEVMRRALMPARTE
jgi:hypothetical protein